jgi:hypothetical protein
MSGRDRLLRVGSYNFMGGISPQAQARMRDDLEFIAGHGLDVLAAQELKHWTAVADQHRQLYAAEQILKMRGVLIASNSDGCDLALFYHPSRIHIIEERHRWTGFHHAVCCVRAAVGIDPATGDDATLIDLASGHMAPSSPEHRFMEAEKLKLFLKDPHPVIIGADWNAAALGENPATDGIDPEQAAQKLDRRPAHKLQAYGLTDVGAHLGDITPTVGHTRGGRLAYRCDRIHTTLPVATYHQYEVVPGGNSDHRLTVAAFDLAAAYP